MADKSGQTFEMPKPSKLAESVVASFQSNDEHTRELTREKVMEIPLTEIDPFPDHPFLVKQDEAMKAMVDSIKAFGIQTPAIVRQKEDGRYELISGHRRKLACELAGLDKLPCIIRNLSRDDAIIAMIDANLQRENILPSEKAKSYKMRLDAMSRQGKRTDLTSVENQQKLKGVTSRQLMSEKTGDSQDKIRNYIRLNELIPQLLDIVDNSVIREKDKLQIAIRPAVELSYIPKKQQKLLLDVINANDNTPTHDQTIRMRKAAEEGRLDVNVIQSIMQEAKPNQVEHFRIRKERLDKFFAPGTSAQKIEETIIRALDALRQREKSRNGEAR